MVLGDDFHGEVVFQNRDVRMAAYGFHQSALDFKTCVVSMVQDAEFRMSAFAVQVEVPLFVFVEVYAPFHKVSYALRCVFHYLFHGCRVADEIPCNHGVFDMFLEVVHFHVGHGSYSSLCLGRVGLFQCGFTYDGHLAFACIGHLQGVTHSGYSRTYH